MSTSIYRKIVDEISSWPGVITTGSPLQGAEFRLGSSQLGHLHSFDVGHLPVSTDLYTVLIESGTAKPHPVFTNSNWIEVPVPSLEDAERLIALFRLNYNLFQQLPAA